MPKETHKPQAKTLLLCELTTTKCLSFPLTGAAFSQLLNFTDTQLTARKVWVVCLTSFCFASLSLAISCEKWQVIASSIIKNQRLKTEASLLLTPG